MVIGWPSATFLKSAGRVTFLRSLIFHLGGPISRASGDVILEPGDRRHKYHPSPAGMKSRESDSWKHRHTCPEPQVRGAPSPQRLESVVSGASVAGYVGSTGALCR